MQNRPHVFVRNKYITSSSIHSSPVCRQFFSGGPRFRTYHLYVQYHFENQTLTPFTRNTMNLCIPYKSGFTALPSANIEEVKKHRRRLDWRHWFPRCPNSIYNELFDWTSLSLPRVIVYNRPFSEKRWSYTDMSGRFRSYTSLLNRNF
jgi:hypothetical protein